MPGLKQESESFFSSREFISAVASVSGAGYRALPLPVDGSGPARTMYALAARRRLQTRSLQLAPYGLWASPGWDAALEDATVSRLLDVLQGLRTRDFRWHVRFDHLTLASKLMDAGLTWSRVSTRVLYLDRDHDSQLRKYNATIRNQIRRCAKSDVKVRCVSGGPAVDEYYRVHTEIATAKSFKTVYPSRLIKKLVENCNSTRLFVAEYEDRVIAGGIFFWDGCSILHWHGAADRNYNRFFPTCGLLNAVIQWASEQGATFFDFGSSAGIASLDSFKSFWGAMTESHWCFEWRNPGWDRLSRLASRVRRMLA